MSVATACRALDRLPAPWRDGDRVLSEEALLRAFPPDAPRWQRGEAFVRRLLSAKEDGREPLKVVVIGGSMTAGSECDRAHSAKLKPTQLCWTCCPCASCDHLCLTFALLTAAKMKVNAKTKKEALYNRTFGEHQTQCAWPARLGCYLAKVFGPTVSLVSLAKGAHSTTEWAAAFNRHDTDLFSADLIIAELSVNDQHIADANASRMHVVAASAVLFHNLLSLPRQPAVLALEAVRGAFTSNVRENMREVRLMCPGVHPINQSSERTLSQT